MSDFFSSIITKSLAPVLMIAPRPVSRFEPIDTAQAAETLFTAQALDDGEAIAEHEGSPAIPLFRPQVTPATQPQQRSDTPEAPFARPPAPAIKPQQTDHVRSTTPVVAQSLVEHTPLTNVPTMQLGPAPELSSAAPMAQIAAQRSEASRPNRQATLPTAAPSITQIVERIVSERNDKRASILTRIEPAPAPRNLYENAVRQQAVASAELQQTDPRQFVGETTEPIEPSAPAVRPLGLATLAHTPQPLFELPTARELLAVRSEAAQQHSQAAPAIHVTIGRIEVRATTTQASTSHRQRAAAPVMGLDEYLRQRSGGGSR